MAIPETTPTEAYRGSITPLNRPNSDWGSILWQPIDQPSLGLYTSSTDTDQCTDLQQEMAPYMNECNVDDSYAGVAYFAEAPLENPETVFLQFTQVLTHPWIGSILLAGGLAAIMSTVESQLLVCSGVISEDFYKGMLRPSASDRELVNLGRISVIVRRSARRAGWVKPALYQGCNIKIVNFLEKAQQRLSNVVNASSHI